MDERHVLRIQLKRGGRVEEIINFLIDLNTVYNALYFLDYKINELKNINNKLIISDRSLLRSEIAVQDTVLPYDKLRIIKIELNSPGFIDFFGKQQPLKELREYIKDRDERRKDREWREGLQKEEMELNNEKKKIDIIKEKINILRDLGYSEDAIRKFINSNYILPIEGIDRHQDSGLIGSAEIQQKKHPESKKWDNECVER